MSEAVERENRSPTTLTLLGVGSRISRRRRSSVRLVRMSRHVLLPGHLLGRSTFHGVCQRRISLRLCRKSRYAAVGGAGRTAENNGAVKVSNVLFL